MKYRFIIDFPSFIYNNQLPGQESEEIKIKILKLKTQEQIKLIKYKGMIINGITKDFQYKLLEIDNFKGIIEQLKSDGVIKEKSLKDFNIVLIDTIKENS